MPLPAGESSFVPVSGARSTIDSAEIEVNGTTDDAIFRDVGTTDGDPIADPAGQKVGPTCPLIGLTLCAIGLFHLPS